VKGFWNRGRTGDVEATLRRSRPQPSDEFVTSLAEHVDVRRRSTRRGMRLALAGALTVALLAALAPVGALGYASGAAKGVVNAAARVASVHARSTVASSPSSDQYHHVKKCKKGTKRKGNKCVKVKSGAKGQRISRRGPRFTG
jgi:hypothetical protein